MVSNLKGWQPASKGGGEHPPLPPLNEALTSDHPVELYDLSLDLHTSHLEKKPALSVLSIGKSDKKQRRKRWSANVAITSEQSVFNEIHNVHV